MKIVEKVNKLIELKKLDHELDHEMAVHEDNRLACTIMKKYIKILYIELVLSRDEFLDKYSLYGRIEYLDLLTELSGVYQYHDLDEECERVDKEYIKCLLSPATVHN